MPVEAQYNAFNRPMQEAVDYVASLKPEFKEWAADRSGIAHSKSFMVAGITRTDALQDIHDMTRAALDKGQSLGAFRRDFVNQFRSKGWDVRGETGQSDPYLGWRAELIYNNNMRAAHMAGQWQQFQQSSVPYLRYSAIMDGKTRPLHRQWHGTIRAKGDAFWLTHYPPCGFNCRCTVTGVFDFDLKDNNWQVDTEPFKPQYRDVISRATGEITDRVPVGIDAGFDHNVGMSWVSPEQALGRKLAALPKPLQGLMVDKTISPVFLEAVNTNFKTWLDSVQAEGVTRGALQTVGFMDSAVLGALEPLIIDKKLRLYSTSVSINVNDQKLRHLSGFHKSEKPDNFWPTEMIEQLPVLLANYRAVFWDNKNSTILIIPQAPHKDRIAYIAIGSGVSKPTDYYAPTILSLGARRASDYLLKDKDGLARFSLILGSLK
jgi:SPP1 gp7 family putative phage head morphogenesis protein